MRENWLEEGLRDKFEGFDSELNLEEAWGTLEQTRNAPNKRRLGWLWIVTGSLLFLGSSLAVFQLTTNETTEITDAPVKAKVSNVISQKQKEVVDVNDVKETLVSDQISKSETPLSGTSSIKTSQRQQKDTPNRNTQTTLSNNLVYDAPSSYPTTRQNNVTNQNNLTAVDQVNDSAVSTVGRQSAALTQSNLAINQITLLAGVSSKLQRDSKQVLNHKIADFLLLDRVKKSKSIPQFVGIDFGFSPVTNGQVLANEEALDGISASLFYKKHLSRRFYLKTGLGLDRFMTKQEGSTENSFTSIEPDQIVERIIYQDGTIENVLGDGEVTTTESTTYQLYNSYQFVSIPVVAGFRIVDRDLTSIEVEGGMSTTISSQYDVKEYDPANGGQVNQLADLNLRNTSVFSGLLAAQWNYHPKSLKRLGLFMKVGTRFQLNDISTDESFNIDKFRSYQLGLGLQYRL